ncbi:MAG: hypothetical protein ACTSR0_04000 [Candidatus Asgardarchaeia archaeon]
MSKSKRYKTIMIKKELYDKLLGIMFEKRLRSIPKTIAYLISIYQKERSDNEREKYSPSE